MPVSDIDIYSSVLPLKAQNIRMAIHVTTTLRVHDIYILNLNDKTCTIGKDLSRCLQLCLECMKFSVTHE